MGANTKTPKGTVRMETHKRDAHRHNRPLKFTRPFLVLVLCSLIAELSFSAPAECLLADPNWQASTHNSAGQDDAFQRALIALRENRFDAALEELTTAEREHPADARVRSFRGIVLVRLGRNSEAASEYREAIRIDPRMEDAYRNLGFLEWTEHRLDGAREELEHAVELSPDDSFAHYYLGRVQLDAQLYEKAFLELKRSGVAWPPDPEFLIAAATGYLSLGQQEEARRTLDRLATLSLSAAQSAHVASLLLLVHENDTAIHLVRKFSDPTAQGPAPWAQFDLGLIYLLAGNYKAAVGQGHLVTDAARPAGSNPGEAAPAWSLTGIANARLGEAEPAVNALRRASALAPGQEEHWLNLTRELMELNRYADAISATHEGLVSNPRSYALNLRLGAANLSAGRYEEAEKVFRELVAAGDPLPTSYIGLAQVLLRTDRVEEAVSELAAARQKLGSNFLISYFQGLSLDRAGKRLEAISAFQEALQLNPGSAEAHLGLGKTELALGRATNATAELEEALRLSPDNEQARRLLRQAYHRAGDAKSAAKYAETTVEAPAAAESDLLGDFLLPPWQGPPEHTKQ
jgi:Flp pilus assembly protein TadD